MRAPRRMEEGSDRDRPPRKASTADSAEPASISGADFARFAGQDVDCWRQIVGSRLLPVCEAWGPGVVAFVAWGSSLEHVLPYVQIVTDYEQVGRVRCCADTWSLHHREAEIAHDVRRAIDACLCPELSEDERADRIQAQARQWRARRDQQVLETAHRRGASSPQPATSRRRE